MRIEAHAGQTHFFGLYHLGGQDVSVLAGGAVIDGMTVTIGGDLDLPATAVPDTDYILMVGLPYTATATTLPPEFKLQSGSAQGLKKRVRKLILRLLETLGMRAGQAGRGQLDEIEELDRPASAFMDAPRPLYSGDTAGLVDTEYDRDGQITFSSSDPLPAIVTAAMLTMEVDTRDA